MSINSLFRSLPNLRRRNLNLNEIEDLIELLPQSSLLLEVDKNQIVLANAKVTELTAYTRVELTSLAIDDLLPGFIDTIRKQTDVENKDPIAGEIIKRNGSSEAVLISYDPLGDDSCSIVTIETEKCANEQQAEQARQENRLNNLLCLFQSTQELNVNSALDKVIQTGQNLTGASLLGVYLADAAEPGMQSKISSGDVTDFPKRILPNEIDELSEATIWVLGKRATTNLHKFARSSDYSYLATAPIGKSEAITGLIVIADKVSNPPPDVLTILDILSSTVSNIIQHHILTSNSIESLNGKYRASQIKDQINSNIQEGILVLSKDLKIREMNSASEWMLGYACREVIDQPVEHVIIGAENLVSALQAAQKGISTPNLGSVRLHRRDGSAFLSHLNIEPIIMDEIFDGVILILRDLSEREEIEERNQQLEQRAILGEVTSIFAHEVRNPLNNISTSLQLMARNLPENDPNQELIEQSREDLRRILHLTESTLEFARPSETKMETVDVAVLLERLLNRWHPRLARLNVVPHFEVHCDKPEVTADPRALEQVFSNLIGNALDAMNDLGGTLGVSIKSNETQDGRSQVEISISDTGPGIPEDVQVRIFEPFFTTKNQKGTGLGLAIARRIVTRHNGTIEINSVPGGSVFLVNLPAANQRKNQNNGDNK